MPSKRIASILRRSAALEDDAVRAQIALLRAARRDVMRSIGSAAGYRSWQLGQVLAGIDAELARYVALAQAQASGDAQAALELGASIVDASTVYGVSPELLSSVVDVMTDQTRSIWSELGTKLKANVRRATLGITDQFQAIQALAKAIKDPKVFGTAKTRAEVVLRTETGRAFSMASDASMRQAVDAGVKMGKAWLASSDSRTRPSHAAAGRRYSVDKPIPVKRAFIVGGARLRFPGDPLGPAKETILCRCRTVPVLLEEE